MNLAADFPVPGKGATHAACKSLWAAVLWQALGDAVRLARAKRPTPRHWHQDALDWFANESVEIGSFRWICDLMGLDPNRVRERVERMMVEARRRKGALPRFLTEM